MKQGNNMIVEVDSADTLGMWPKYSYSGCQIGQSSKGISTKVSNVLETPQKTAYLFREAQLVEGGLGIQRVWGQPDLVIVDGGTS